MNINEKLKTIKDINSLIEYLEVQHYDAELNKKKIILLEEEIDNIKIQLQILGGLL